MYSNLKNYWLMFVSILIVGVLITSMLDIALLLGVDNILGIIYTFSDEIFLNIAIIISFSLASYLLFTRIWAHAVKGSGFISAILYIVVTTSLIAFSTMFIQALTLHYICGEICGFVGGPLFPFFPIDLAPLVYSSILLFIFSLLVYKSAKKKLG